MGKKEGEGERNEWEEMNGGKGERKEGWKQELGGNDGRKKERNQGDEIVKEPGGKGERKREGNETVVRKAGRFYGKRAGRTEERGNVREKYSLYCEGAFVRVVRNVREKVTVLFFTILL